MSEDLSRVGPLTETLHWRIRKHLVFFWEVPTDLLAPVIPDRLDLAEIRPGTTLAALEMLHYKVGHFREGYREFHEAVFAATVQPDLSIEMPMPRFSMFAIRVISDSTEFCHSEGSSIFTPTHHVPGFRTEFSADGTSCSLFDHDQPIAICRNTAPAVPVRKQTIWGQYFTNTRGLQRGVWRWDGLAAEHMERGDASECHRHLLWNGVDMTNARSTYRQMRAEPEATDLRFYHAGPL
jgi:hypothetical protein